MFSASRHKLRFAMIIAVVLLIVLSMAGGAYFVYYYQQSIYYEGKYLKLRIPHGWKRLDLEQVFHQLGWGYFPTQGEEPEEDLVLVHPSGLSVTIMVYPAESLPKDSRDMRNPRWLAPRVADLYRAECAIWNLPPSGYLYETFDGKSWVLSGVLGTCDVLIVARQPDSVPSEKASRLIQNIVCSLHVRGYTPDCKQLRKERVSILPIHSQEWHALGASITLPDGWVPADLLLPGSCVLVSESVVHLPLVHRSHPRKRLTVWYSIPTHETRQDYARYREAIARRLMGTSGSRQTYSAGKYKVVRVVRQREGIIDAEWYCFAESFVCFAKSRVSRQGELSDMDALVAAVVSQLGMHTMRS